jgi:hypothetical protein
MDLYEFFSLLFLCTRPQEVRRDRDQIGTGYLPVPQTFLSLPSCRCLESVFIEIEADKRTRKHRDFAETPETAEITDPYRDSS